MINMMNDILQYLPYALLLAAVFGLMFAGVVFTILRFRKAEKRLAQFPASKRRGSIAV